MGAADWEARKTARSQHSLEAVSKAAVRDCETESNCTDVSTAPTMTPLLLDDAEVEAELERILTSDKHVRKLRKTLGEIVRLEGRDDLDVLQRIKLQRKSEIEIELDTAKGLAGSRARDKVRKMFGR